MDRLISKKQSGITSNALHTWGMLFLTIGIVGKSIFQNRLLGAVGLNTQQLLAAMDASENAMMYATIGLVMQAMETCAVPIFAYLLVEGWQHTGSRMNYAKRVLGLALLSEVPYNLAMSGKLLDVSSRNPVFGILFCMIALYFYGVYEEKCFKNTTIKLLVTIGAFLWVTMLKIEYGGCLVILMGVLWAYRSNSLMRNMAGATGAIVCMLYSPLFLVAPMGMLAVHMYNGEQGEDNRLVNYLAYPAVLLAVAVAGIFLV